MVVSREVAEMGPAILGMMVAAIGYIWFRIERRKQLKRWAERERTRAD